MEMTTLGTGLGTGSDSVAKIATGAAAAAGEGGPCSAVATCCNTCWNRFNQVVSAIAGIAAVVLIAVAAFGGMEAQPALYAFYVLVVWVCANDIQVRQEVISLKGFKALLDDMEAEVALLRIENTRLKQEVNRFSASNTRYEQLNDRMRKHMARLATSIGNFDGLLARFGQVIERGENASEKQVERLMRLTDEINQIHGASGQLFQGFQQKLGEFGAQLDQHREQIDQMEKQRAQLTAVITKGQEWDEAHQKQLEELVKKAGENNQEQARLNIEREAIQKVDRERQEELRELLKTLSDITDRWTRGRQHLLSLVGRQFLLMRKLDQTMHSRETDKHLVARLTGQSKAYLDQAQIDHKEFFSGLEACLRNLASGETKEGGAGKDAKERRAIEELNKVVEHLQGVLQDQSTDWQKVVDRIYQIREFLLVEQLVSIAQYCKKGLNNPTIDFRFDEEGSACEPSLQLALILGYLEGALTRADSSAQLKKMYDRLGRLYWDSEVERNNVRVEVRQGVLRELREMGKGELFKSPSYRSLLKSASDVGSGARAPIDLSTAMMSSSPTVPLPADQTAIAMQLLMQRVGSPVLPPSSEDGNRERRFTHVRVVTPTPEEMAAMMEQMKGSGGGGEK